MVDRDIVMKILDGNVESIGDNIDYLKGYYKQKDWEEMSEIIDDIISDANTIRLALKRVKEDV